MATMHEQDVRAAEILAKLRQERFREARETQAHLDAAEANLRLLRIPGATPVRAKLPVD